MSASTFTVTPRPKGIELLEKAIITLTEEIPLMLDKEIEEINSLIEKRGRKKDERTS